MGALDIVILVIGTAATIAGSALMWRANKDADVVMIYNNGTANVYAPIMDNQRSAVQYETLVFCFAALAAWIHELSAEKDSNGRVIWRYLFYGFVYFASVTSFNNWQAMDYNRHFYDNDSGMFMNTDANKKLFGGEVIAYGGMLLLLWNVHGAMQSRGFCTVLLFLISVGLNVVGSVILWKLDNTMIAANSSDRTTVFQIAVSQWVTLLILGGGVLHKHVDGAHGAVLGLGYFGIWYLSRAFLLKEGNDGEQGEKAWAGSLFCWFSAWASLITARWAAANYEKMEA